MITSDYLEQVVDFDQPILVVGPGADHRAGLNYDLCAPPMDRAAIWFAERLAGRKGRLDVFEQDYKAPEGGSHCWFKVRNYFHLLASRVPLGTINFIIGDITKYPLPEKEYGLIWDHGTLQVWIKNDAVDRTLENYSNAITEKGIIAISGYDNISDKLEKNERINETRRIELTDDAYRTGLTSEQLESGLAEKRSLLQEGLLLPRYSYNTILELRR
ncbi:MAG: hypothetical protein WCV90_06015 [Candidatus Woesearchaeota archaeon]